MDGRMREAPVYFTIVQARFNPILTLDSAMPAIQDRLRVKGFPDYQRLVVATLNLHMGATPLPQGPMTPLIQYTFGNMDKTSSFILDQGSLSLQTTSYEDFEVFSTLFLEGLGVVHEIVSLGYTEKVGVRYLDAVLPREGEQLDTYLAKSVQGLLGVIDGKLQYAFSETRATDEAVMVVARTVVQNGKVGFPPDLQMVGLTVGNRFTSYTGLHAILDTDASYERRDVFDLDRLRDPLARVHHVAGQAFRASVTDTAMQIWK